MLDNHIPNPTWSCHFQFPSVGGELESFGLWSIFEVGRQTTSNVDGVDHLVTTPLNIVHKSHDDLLEIEVEVFSQRFVGRILVPVSVA